MASEELQAVTDRITGISRRSFDSTGGLEDAVDDDQVIDLQEMDVPAAAPAARRLSRSMGEAIQAVQRRSSRSSIQRENSKEEAWTDPTAEDMNRQESGESKEDPLMGHSETAKAKRAKNSRRRGSLAIMTDLFGTGTSRIGSNSGQQSTGRSRKLSLSVWSNFTTVAFNQDAKLDFEDYFAQAREESFTDQILLEVPTWIVPGLVGALTACSGYLIEKMVDWLGDMRLGICLDSWNGWWFSTKESCADGGWHEYENPWPGYINYVWISSVLATTAAAMTWAFAPMARGSGIPEIKTVLGGFVMREVLEFNTLIVKIFGLALSVAAGLSCGKEGPLVHIACCWSHVICKLTPRFARNEGKQRECLSCACAAGVAIAFGAPLGGVLFSLEEASTYFPTRTMIRGFFAASAAATVMQFLKTDAHGTKPLTMFQADYTSPPHVIEYIFFVILGLLGGCIGALFVHYNVMVSKARAPGTPFRKRCHVVLEVFLIAFVTAITSYPILFTRVISNSTIRALFINCYNMQIPPGVEPQDFHLGICQEDGNGGHEPTISFGSFTEPGIVPLLAMAGLLRYGQMIFTFGTGTPSGLFIPSLYSGAVLGRILGILVLHLNHIIGFRESGAEIYPGIYSMMGAAAVLGGVCRVTISLVVIMFELTGGIQLIVPFMIVCLLSKWVGDAFTPGIYDYYITVRKYPYLHEPDHTQFNLTAEDIMDTTIDVIHPQEQTVASMDIFLRQYSKHSGYPITVSRDDTTLLGYIHAKPLREHMEFMRDLDNIITDETKVGFWSFLSTEKPAGSLDLTRFVDQSVHRIVPETPAAEIHNMFRLLGIKIVLVVSKGDLVGMITKKAYISFMSTSHAKDAQQAKMNSPAKGSKKMKRGLTLLT